MQISILSILLTLLLVPAVAQVAGPLQQVSMNSEIETWEYIEDTTLVEHIVEEWIENLVIDPKLTINEGLSIDCVWVNQHSYFSHWNSGKINPYKLDGANFKVSDIHYSLLHDI